MTGYGFGLYGSSHVGSLAAVVEKTSTAGILQLDCLKTDFFHDKAYPTFLYYNPHAARKTVTIQFGPARKDLYDPVSHQFIARNVRGRAELHLPPDSATMVVVAPARATQTQHGRKLLLDGVIVDYAAP